MFQKLKYRVNLSLNILPLPISKKRLRGYIIRIVILLLKLYELCRIDTFELGEMENLFETSVNQIFIVILREI